MECTQEIAVAVGDALESGTGAGDKGFSGHIEATQRAAPVQQHGSTMAFIHEAMGFGRAATADPDAEAMSDKIKQHMQALTQDATEYLLCVKQRMLTSLEAAVASEQDAGFSKLAAKQAEVDMLKTELQQTQKQLNHAERYLERLSSGFALRHQAVLDGKSFLIAWFSWRQHIARKRRLARQWIRAEQYYIQTWLLGRAWNRWAGRARSHYRQLAAQRAENQRDKEIAALNDVHEHEKLGLTAEIQALQQQLQLEAEARNRMEEEMKRAFMRGVTAINLEAVQIMRRGAPPAGVNPFPVTLPLNANTAAAGLAAAVQQRQHQEQQLAQQEQQQTEGYVVTPAPVMAAAAAAAGNIQAAVANAGTIQANPASGDISPAAALSPGLTQPSAAAGVPVVQNNVVAAEDAAMSPMSTTGRSVASTGTSSPRVQAMHPVMRPVGALSAVTTFNSPGAGQAQLQDACWSSSSVSPVAVVQPMANSMPRVIVERGPAAGGHSRLAQASDVSSGGRVAGGMSQTPAGRATGGGRGFTAGHVQAVSRQRH